MIRQLCFIVIFLGLISPCSLSSQEAEKVSANQAVRLDLSLDKRVYEMGEAIDVNIRLRNVGDTWTTISEGSEVTGRHDGYSFVVRNENGEVLRDPMHEFISLMHSLGGIRSLYPGNSYDRKLTLNYRVPSLQPGRYTVKGVYRPMGLHRGIEVESQSVILTIVDTPRDGVQNRVRQLTQELRNGGDARRIAPLLGFTGHIGAIAPLIDTFYTLNEGDQVAAAQALLYLDHDSVKKALLESLEVRGPRDRMMHLLIVRLQAKTAEVVPILQRWIKDEHGEIRYAAIEGLFLANRDKDPKLLPLLIAGSRDPLPKVRHRAVAAIGSYQDAAALEALKTAVGDPDQGVREQATTAVGWVATAAKVDSSVRVESMDILLKKLRSDDGAGHRAAYWLGKVGDKRVVGEMAEVLETTSDPKLRRELQQALRAITSELN